MNPAVMMGDPAYFRIVAGSNPFTRDRFGRRKHVDRKKAVQQWHALARLLTEMGVDVYVIPPSPEAPGLVYPANAGFLASDGTFVLSRLIPARAAETPRYASFLEKLGLKTAAVSHRFEGEADFFPAAGKMIFSSGQLQEQRFVWRWGVPPWKRVYGFRSDAAALAELQGWVPTREIVPVRLVKEAYYHGDTCLCSFGENREYLLAYLPALDEESQERLKRVFAERLIELSEEDASLYAANSFYFETAAVRGLAMPEGVSRGLREAVAAAGAQTVLADVSEFLLKGGGSVKCMIGTLGALPAPADQDTQRFRAAHLYKP